MIKIARGLYRDHKVVLSELRAAGVRRLVFLHNSLGASEYEYIPPTSGSMEQAYVRFSRLRPPSPSQVHRAMGLLVDDTDQCVITEDADSAGFVIAVYRMRVQGWTFKEAHDEWVRLSHRHWSKWWWKFALKRRAQ
jgi:hypothetical protein